MSPLDYPVSTIDAPLRVSGKFFCSGNGVNFLKVVTFGPFPAGAFPDEGICQLKSIRDDLGANAIRVYEIPTLLFLHECARYGLRVFITLPWSQHVDFTRESHVLAEADQLLLETIKRFRGHPAVAGYFIGNEIETTLVRWMGKRQVLEQLERLIDLGHANDPDALFAYANYPSTEYLLPRNQDFVAFNLYLEDRESFARYLSRLQNLAGDKPLLISEFGVDAENHGEDVQSEMLKWHVEEACRAGAAGTTVFAWSDLWQRGGNTIEEYSFGLKRRDDTAKPAMGELKEKWGPLQRGSDELPLEATPSMSVIVCTYRGSATLVECLDSLVALDYPAVELLLVNDGSDNRVSELVAEYDKIREISIPHSGLSAARNIGAEAAQGEILVYTDDDCIVEPDWLRWMAHQFLRNDSVGCAGGPNIPPAPQSAMQAVIAAAPGGPTHVLLTDAEAEHLPGCNLAVRKDVFEEVGGFNPIFRTAGDDVDFCWRVLEAGYDLGFHAAAFVWHHRRFSYRTYFRQQFGYGKAEAMLMPLHRQRFRGLGGAVWKGQVYTSRSPVSSFVYHGHYGYEPFQLIYPDENLGMSEVCLHALWWLLAIALIVGGFWVGGLFIPAGLMVAGSVFVARRRALRAGIDAAFDGPGARISVALLVLAQGFLRSGSRLALGWKDAKWSRGLEVVTTATLKKVASGWWKLGKERSFWSGEGIARDEFLTAVREIYPKAEVDETGRTDLILSRGWFWNWALITATEYHEDNKRLTRMRLLGRPEPVMRFLVLPLVVGVIVAVGLGWGLKNELLTLGILSAIAFFASRLFVAVRIPRLVKAARLAGLEPV
ncbi:MAG: glycosyltransferase [Verrucomicrobiales bacterium]|nr:glycosyltransferase [Verrucomicrobiales bacterium]